MMIVPTPSVCFHGAIISTIIILLDLTIQVESWNLSPSPLSLRLPCRHLSSPLSYSSRTTSSRMPVGRHQNMDQPSNKLRLAATSSSSDDTTQDLLEKARKLREQAKSLEDNLDRKATSSSPASSRSSSSSSASSGASPAAQIKPPSEIEDSVWTISYRFSSQPETDKDNENEGSSSFTPVQQQQQPQQRRRTFYSGKITLKFKNDGYTDVVSTDSDDNSNNEDFFQIIKAWGWDKETSNEDNLEYLLWSMDVRLPTTDPDLPGQQERFYFQARVDDENEGRAQLSSPILSLKDGTVTVKKDVAEKTSGWWGVFRVGGILTRFRYTGDFVARPSSVAAALSDSPSPPSS